MTYILSKCLFSQVAGMHTHTGIQRHGYQKVFAGILSKSCSQTNEVEPNSPSPTSFSSNRTVHSLRSEQLNFVSKVFGNGIWGIIETLCHSKVQMADLERLAFQRFLANQKCIRTCQYVLLLATYPMQSQKNQAGFSLQDEPKLLNSTHRCQQCR